MELPETQTAEEREERKFCGGLNPAMAPPQRPFVLGDLAAPEALKRREWEARQPALGLSESNLLALEAHVADHRLLPVQLRILFSSLRATMLRQLISCSGAATVPDLCKILREELQSGTPAPAPDWYSFSSCSIFGPSKNGYESCCNRGCLTTESIAHCFQKCSQCRAASYCRKECPTADWKVRHKKVCTEAAEKCEAFASMGKKMQRSERQGPAGMMQNKNQETLLLDRRVAIDGLVAKPELNGRTGTVVSFDEDKGRYSVELDDTSSSLMIKPCNLLPTPVCSVALCSLLFSQTRPRIS
jgi:hypothetical protein